MFNWINTKELDEAWRMLGEDVKRHVEALKGKGIDFKSDVTELENRVKALEEAAKIIKGNYLKNNPLK